MLNCDLNKVTLKIYYANHTSALVFFYNFASYVQNIFSLEHRLVDLSWQGLEFRLKCVFL